MSLLLAPTLSAVFLAAISSAATVEEVALLKSAEWLEYFQSQFLK